MIFGRVYSELKGDVLEALLAGVGADIADVGDTSFAIEVSEEQAHSPLVEMVARQAAALAAPCGGQRIANRVWWSVDDGQSAICIVECTTVGPDGQVVG